MGTVRNSRGPWGRGEPLTPSAVPAVTGVSGWTAGVRWRGVLEHWTAASASGHFLCIRTLILHIVFEHEFDSGCFDDAQDNRN